MFAIMFLVITVIILCVVDKPEKTLEEQMEDEITHAMQKRLMLDEEALNMMKLLIQESESHSDANK